MSGRAWLMVLCGVVVVLVAGGLRQAFGVFLRPVSLDLQIGREVFGLVIAVQALLYGVCQPAVGLLADRIGACPVVILGALLYASGLRISELMDARLDNLDFDEGVIRVTGKGNKTRLVPVGRRAIAAVEKYLELERPKLVRPRTGSEIFLSVRGGKLTTQRGWQILRERAKAAGPVACFFRYGCCPTEASTWAITLPSAARCSPAISCSIVLAAFVSWATACAVASTGVPRGMPT